MFNIIYFIEPYFENKLSWIYAILLILLTWVIRTKEL